MEAKSAELRSIREINDEIKLKSEYEPKRPAQIIEQDVFNKWFLEILNTKVGINSKGKNKLQITDENEWLLNLMLCYLNCNADDKTLTYSIKIGNDTTTQTLDLNKGISLLGNFGVGKTLLLRCIHEHRAQLRLNGFFVTSRQLYDTKKQDLVNVIGRDHANLFIDDLGDEPMKSVNYGQEDTPVAMVLKQKLDAWERLPESPKIFISSNCGITKLRELYGGRIVSRLYGATNVIITTQKQDFRKS